ncbi:MAG TPA: hypothetical protein VM690_08985, partial [Gaiellaceae bacterium]|nr:hypothetical protein [Gaiellaceae bacterium]
ETTNGGMSSYRTTLNLNSQVTDATVTLPTTWGGQFNISSGPCATDFSNNTPSAPPSTSPASSPSVQPSVAPSASPEDDETHSSAPLASPSGSHGQLQFVGRTGNTITLNLCFPGLGCRLVTVPVVPSSGG